MRQALLDKIRKLLDRDLGGAEDNVVRARAAFRGMNAEEMKQQYGQSGETRQAVLDSYEKWYAEAKADLEEFDAWRSKQ